MSSEKAESNKCELCKIEYADPSSIYCYECMELSHFERTLLEKLEALNDTLIGINRDMR